MKKTFCILVCAILLCSLAGAAFAEATSEYRDSVYAFRYPATWSQAVADNGDIVLISPDQRSAVLTFAIITDLISFTGDVRTDAPLIEQQIASYSGNNLRLNGKYDPIQAGDMHGYRAYGAWESGNLDAVYILLTGSRHLVGFMLAGADALALEQSLLDSVELLGGTPNEGSAGFIRWEGARFSLDYPEQYSTMEMNGAVAFLNAANATDIIMAKAISLDGNYTDELAPIIAATYLPKSAKLEADAEMVTIGGRSAAVIKGFVGEDPMTFYAFGSGKTAVALSFIGDRANDLAARVIGSVTFQ